MRRPARAVGHLACPGGCGWDLDYDLPDLQGTLDAPVRVANGLVERVRAVDVVEAVLLGHLAVCAPAQDALTAARRPWKKAITRQPLPTLAARHHDLAAPRRHRGDT